MYSTLSDFETDLAGKVLSTCAASVGQHAQPFLQLLGLVIQPLL